MYLYCAHNAGHTVLNRPVLVIVGSRLPTQKPLLYRVLLHFVLMLEVYGQSRYDYVLLIILCGSVYTADVDNGCHMLMRRVGIHVVVSSFCLLYLDIQRRIRSLVRARNCAVQSQVLWLATRGQGSYASQVRLSMQQPYVSRACQS